MRFNARAINEAGYPNPLGHPTKTLAKAMGLYSMQRVRGLRELVLIGNDRINQARVDGSVAEVWVDVNHAFAVGPHLQRIMA